MKRTFKLALGAVMTAALVVPAMAQDNFPDTPANHWAYEALARLKRDGLLVGYPDGLFRGSRPASRYELAVAIHAAYTNLRNAVDGLETQIKNIPTNSNADDIKNLKDALTNLQSQVSGLSAYGEDISNLKKAAETFDKELKSLGVDVDALKKGLSDLDARVKVLESKKPAVTISGDINLLLLAGNSRDDRPGLDKDGGLNGITSDGGPVGLTRDLTILHEGAFTLSGTSDTAPKWSATIVTTNTGLSRATLPGGNYSEGATDIYVESLVIPFSTSILGLGFDVKAGRVGYKVSPYIFQRPDTTSYYANERWDNGEYTFDGGVLGFKFGAAKLDVFGGKNSRLVTNQGFELNPIIISNNRVPGTTLETAGISEIDRSLGLNLNVPILQTGNLNLSYLWLDSDTTTLAAPAQSSSSFGNRLAVYGGTADFAFGRIKVDGGYSKSNVQYNSSNINNSDNSAWNANATYAGENFKIMGGYREVEANYVAPGDWGRLGILRNPANIKGFQVGGSLNLKPGLLLEAKGEFDKGKSDIGTLFNTDTKIESYTVKLGYNLTESLNAALSYEDTKFKSLPGETLEPHFRWYSLGIGYSLSPSAKLSFAYEISDHENVNAGPFADYANKYTGGLLSTQLTVKF